MSKLSTLSERVKSLKIPNIDSEKLSEKIKELDNLPGNEDAKNSVALQLQQFLYQKIKRKKNLHMTNIILEGVPGTGKSTFCKHLANVLSEMDVFSTKPRSNFSTISEYKNSSSMKTIFYIIGLIILYYILGTFNAVLLQQICVIIINIMIFALIFQWVGGAAATGMKDNEKRTKNEDNIVFTDRSSFISRYLGNTSHDTLQILKDASGKILVIDEAYELCQDDHDHYGKIAIGVINKYISENPGKLIIILIGYKEEIQRNVFSKQRGLERRFLWTLQCGNYKVSDLYKILKYQAREKGDSLPEPRKIGKLIKDNFNYFTAYGGDTEKLLQLANMQKTNRFFETQNYDDDILKYEDFEKAMKQIKLNKENFKQKML